MRWIACTSGIGTRLFLVWALFCAAATLAPFDFQLEGQGTAAFQYGASLRHPRDIGFNLLLFAPFGVFISAVGREWFRDWRFLLLGALAGGAAVSLALEYFQAFLPDRHSSLIDVVSNATGAGLGAVAGRAWGLRLVEGLARLRARTSAAPLAGMVVAYSLVALAGSAALQARTSLDDWDPTYPLLIGNERTGDRMWRGQVLAIELTDESTPEALVRQFSAGGSLVLPGERIVALNLEGSAPYDDAAGNLPPLDWSDGAHLSGAAGVQRTGAWLETTGPADAIAERLAESDAFTLRLQFVADAVQQYGPARIVSNSWDHGSRNFTVGQHGPDVVVRFRTAGTGRNGSRPELVVPGVLASHGTRDLLVTYDGATLRATAADSARISRVTLTPGSVLANAIVHPSTRITVRDVRIWTFGYLALLFVTPAVLLAVPHRRPALWRTFAVLWVPLFAGAFEAVLAMTSGRPLSALDVVVASGIGAAIVALAMCVLAPTNAGADTNSEAASGSIEIRWTGGGPRHRETSPK